MVYSIARFRELDVPNLSRDILAHLDGVLISTHSTLMQAQDQSIDDFVTPSYRRLIDEGHVIENPMQFLNFVYLAQGGGTYEATNTSSGEVLILSGPGSITKRISNIVNPSVIGSLPVGLDTTSADINAAKVRALRNVDTTPAAMLEDTFELRETIRFLKNPVAAFQNLSKSFKRSVNRHPLGRLDRSRAVADVWLTKRFAVEPLVRSMMDIVEVFDASRRTLPPVRRSAHGRMKSEDSDSDEVSAGSPSALWARSGTFSDEVHASILYETTIPHTGIVGSLGFRVKDIPETIWAVMPYSFMVDRVVNITDYIGASINALDPSVRILGATVSRRRDTLSRVSLLDVTNPPWSFVIQGDPVDEKLFDYSRTIWTNLSDIKPVVNTFGLVKDATKITDLLALSLRFFS